MASFSCPHYDEYRDTCVRIGDVCVPGRPGCVLFRNSGFAVPWQQRLEAKRREQAAVPGAGESAEARRRSSGSK